MRKLAVFVGIAVLLTAVAVATTPAPLAYEPATPSIPSDIETYLADSERLVADGVALIPGTEKRVRWFAGPEPTEYAIVYLHGFSATRQELAPMLDRLADALGANLFETRLAGHGRHTDALVGVTAEEWLDDAAEALAIGTRIGERVILIGASTGATLAVAMADHPAMEAVTLQVLLSPNFAPADSRSAWITGPAGALVLRLTAGDTHSFEPRNEAQARYWSTAYPVAAIVEMMRLVDRANARASATVGHSVLTLYSSHDQVVSVAAIRQAVGRMNAVDGRVLDLGTVGDPMNHTLAGQVLSPDETDLVVRTILDYVDELRSPALQ
jgi:alpha-beta hydrolase superfamily lysophospholipase